MRIYVDIDETICLTPPSRDYKLSQPIKDRIEIINKLYDQGHTIVYWTARGYVTKINWEETTRKQFKEWGVKYHDVVFNKPNYDLYIDDKSINTKNFFEGEFEILINQ